MADYNVNPNAEGGTHAAPSQYSSSQQAAYEQAYRQATQGTRPMQQPAQPVQPTQQLPAQHTVPQAPAYAARPAAQDAAQPAAQATQSGVHPAAQGSAQVAQTAAAQHAYQASYAAAAQQAPVAHGGGTAGHAVNAKAAKKAAKANSSGGGFKTFALGFLGAACAFGIGAGVLAANGFFNKQAEPAEAVVESVSDAGTVVLGSDTNTTVAAVDNHTESLAEAVADKVLPSVVGIDVYANYSSNYGSFWGGGSTDTETLSGLGSGVIISKDGYILTNYHVVEGASKLMVTANGDEHEATVVGTDESSDLAVIKVDGVEDLVPVEIGSSDSLRPGQWVMTLGSPFGLEQSVATGIISAVSRTVVVQNSNSIYSYGQQVQPSIYSNMIQTDAAINPGNSGGALVDENGKLIGINSVIESYSGSYSGVGFAIPVDYAMNIATQIIDGKTPTHAQIGVSCTTVDRDLAERYSLGANSGAYINKVYEDSGARAAGLEQGDIVTKINGVSIESSTDLIGQIRAHNPGETVTVTFVRGTETMEAEVTLGSDENTASYAEESGGLNWGGQGNGGQGQGGQGNGYGEGQGGQGFSYEELQELLDYFSR